MEDWPVKRETETEETERAAGQRAVSRKAKGKG